MESIRRIIDPRKVLKDDLLYMSAINSIVGLIIFIFLVFGSILIFGKFKTGNMSGEINWKNIEIAYYTILFLVLICIVLIIFSFYRYNSIKILLKKGHIIDALIISIESFSESELVYLKVSYECLGIKYDTDKRIKGYRVIGLFKTGDVIKIIINPRKPKYFIFKELYTRY
jgi:hypothetical protein